MARALNTLCYVVDGNFSYSGLQINQATISFTVTRTSGSPKSCDTPQVYLSFPGASADPKRPSKVLRFFKKVCDSSNKLSFTVQDADVSNWNVGSKSWTKTTGKYGVLVGSSSQDIHLTGSLTV